MSATVLTLATSIGAAPAASAKPPRIDGWATASPHDVGLRASALKTHAQVSRERSATCLAVVRRGRLARDWNWGGTVRTTQREVWSITKSITSALVGIAEDEGLLSLDDPVSRYVPEWRGTASDSVTVRNLLANDSGRFWSIDSDYDQLINASDRTLYAVGLPQEFPPGSAWAYNNSAIQVLDAVLREATGMSTDDFAQERLFGPLRMTHTQMSRGPSGVSTQTFFGLQTTCLDLARFGQLYLRNGRVGSRRILPRAFVRESVAQPSTRLNAAYGLLWWLNRPGPQRGSTDAVDAEGQPLTPRTGQLAPAASPRMFAALGIGGQVLMVDPVTRTVIVRLGTSTFEQPGGQGFADVAAIITDSVR